MEVQINSNKVCSNCNLEFSCVSAKNRHLKTIHNLKIKESASKKSHIICPLCIEDNLVCGTYNKLEKHLKETHDITLQTQRYNFNTKQNYEQWYEEEKIETCYALSRTTKNHSYVEKSYNCNRSNSIGYSSKSSKRKEKAGGSIKIYGVCPSRLTIKMWKTGEINVNFCKSHVGHKDEGRSQRLSKLEKSEIVTKLCKGVTIDRIILDARNVTSEEMLRINLLNRKNVSYLMKKHNIMKKEHENAASRSVLSNFPELLLEEKPSEIGKQQNEEIQKFILEKKSESDSSDVIDGPSKKEAEIKNLVNFLRSLDEQDYKRCMGQFSFIMRQKSRYISQKRKMDKQLFFPAKKSSLTAFI